MKHFFIIFLLYSSYICSAQNGNNRTTFQTKLNLQYGNKQSTPLKKEELRNFKGLPFYPYDSNMVVIANLTLTPNSPLFKMKTSSDREPFYQQYAIATFILKDQKQELHIYQSQESKFNFDYKDHLFLPFKDLSNGLETYECGRYIDLSIRDINNNALVIDFNKAYNPYCAYNHLYSCPIPPTENHLQIWVKAGVKKGLLKY
jgi:uncharacterized protein (DUF1684 family)